MIENRLPMLSQGQQAQNPFAFQNQGFYDLNPNNRNISATPSEGLSLEKMHAPYTGLASLADPIFSSFMSMPQQQQAAPLTAQYSMPYSGYTPYNSGMTMYPYTSPIGSMIQQQQQPAQTQALPAFGNIDPSVGGWGGWDSTMAPGYTPPTMSQYGSGLWDLFANQLPVTMGGAINQISNYFSAPSIPSTEGVQAPQQGSMWGTPFGQQNIAAPVYGADTSNPNPYSPDPSISVPSFDPGGWGSGYGDGAY